MTTIVVLEQNMYELIKVYIITNLAGGAYDEYSFRVYSQIQ